MTSRSLGQRAPLLWLVLPLLAGLAAGNAGEPVPVPWLLAGALGAAGLALFATWRLPRLWAPALCLAMFLAGNASYALHRRRPAWEGRPAREARLALRIDRVFPQSEAGKTSGLATVVRVDGPMRELAGQRLYFSLALRRGEPAPPRSAVVSALGVLAALPRHPPAGTFDDYLADAGMNFQLTRGRVLAPEQPPSAYRAFCGRAAARLNALLSAGVAGKRPALAAVYRAMMLGQKHDLDGEQGALFMHSGTMHLFAINGLHIGVVAVSLHALLALARCPRLPAAVLTLAVLWLDVDTTGATPSAVRAFLLVACHQTAWVLRLPRSGLAALTAAALLVLLADPLALFSASFQMSYGVVFAILCLGLPLAERLQTRWPPSADVPVATRSWWQRSCIFAARWLGGALGLGLAAALVGAVTGVTYFHFFTPGGLVANLVLVPLAMLVIVAGFASVATGLAGVTAWSLLFNHAAVVVLWVIDALIRAGLHAPGAWWPAQWRAPWAAPLTLAALLAVVLAGYGTGWRREHGGFWPPFLLVALAMSLGVKF